MLHISTCDGVKDHTSWWKDFEILGKRITCKLDSGAEANVMSFDVLKQLCPEPQLENTNTVLTSYSNDASRPLGMTVLPVLHHDKIHPIKFFIVDRSLLINPHWITNMQAVRCVEAC